MSPKLAKLEDVLFWVFTRLLLYSVIFVLICAIQSLWQYKAEPIQIPQFEEISWLQGGMRSLLEPDESFYELDETWQEEYAQLARSSYGNPV